MGKSIQGDRSRSRSYSRSPPKNYKKKYIWNYSSKASTREYSHQKRDYDRYIPHDLQTKKFYRSKSGSRHKKRERSPIRQKRRGSHSRSSSKGARMIFDFEIFLEAPYIKILTENNGEIINKIKDDARIHKIDFDHELSIPGLDGSVIKLSDESYGRKTSALLKILREIEYGNTNSKRENRECSIIILVPEGMVSLLIGSRGKQINNIMRESRAHIVVNPAIHRMTYRTVKIEGRPENVADACEIIYKTLEKISPRVDKIEKTPKPLELHKTRINAKLIFPRNSVGFIIGREGCWVRDLCDKCGVSIKFQQDTSFKSLKEDEAICIIKGKLSGVINAIVIILRRSQEYDISKHYASDVIKLLIPNNFVNKLIGAKGCMIREIAAKAGGAQIKIMSDKQSEREYQDCVVTIAGSLANKQDAVCYILEQIEIFKNGGPVRGILLNGKAINDNLALQFRNSIPPRDSSKRRSSADGFNDYLDIKEEYLVKSNRSPDKEKVEESSGNKLRPSRRSSSKPKDNGLSRKDEPTEPINTNIEVKKEDLNDTNEQTTDPRAERYKELGKLPEPERKRSNSAVARRQSNYESSPNPDQRNKYSQSRSISRSRSRSRSLSKPRLKRIESTNYRSHSSERNGHRSHKDTDKYNSHQKGSSKSKQTLHDRKDVTKNSHYVDAKGELKITTTVIVPNYLVPYLIGKNGEVIKNIETKTTAKISFQRETRGLDAAPINTAEGIRGRIVTIAGTQPSMLEAFGLLMDEIIKLEKSINGTRYEKN